MAAIQLKIFQTFKRKANFIIGRHEILFFYQQWLNYVAMQTLKSNIFCLLVKGLSHIPQRKMRTRKRFYCKMCHLRLKYVTWRN